MNIDDALRQASAGEVTLCDSGWFTNPSPEELASAYVAFGQRFEEAQNELIVRMGDPDLTSESHTAEAKELYYEALRLAGWRRPEGLLVLSLVHHDRETPVIVALEYRNENGA